MTDQPAPAQKRHKATKRDYQNRVEVARLLLLKGQAPPKIIRDMSASMKVTERMARRYVEQAEAQIKGILEVDKLYMWAEHMSHRRDLRERAQKAGDLRVELAAAQDEAKLAKLYPAAELEIHDWRDEARRSGIEDVESTFEQLVQAAMDRANESRGVGGSAAQIEGPGATGAVDAQVEPATGGADVPGG